MKVNLPFFGEQEIDEESIITFPHGMHGFADCTRYKLFHEDGKPTVFWLQSLDDTSVSFSVALPELFNFVYELSFTDEETELLGATTMADLLVLLVLIKPVNRGEKGDYQSSEAPVHSNIHIPVVINLQTRVGLQKEIGTIEQATLLRNVD